MLPRKKLEYYGARYGIRKPAEIRLTQEDCVRVCGAVQVRTYSAEEVGGSLPVLIDRVMDDPDYVKRITAEMRSAHPGRELREDFVSVRIADHAADDVMRAYSS